jgi:hypothetical protein
MVGNAETQDARRVTASAPEASAAVTGRFSFNLRRSAPRQAGFVVAIIGYAWLLSALSA